MRANGSTHNTSKGLQGELLVHCDCATYEQICAEAVLYVRYGLGDMGVALSHARARRRRIVGGSAWAATAEA